MREVFFEGRRDLLTDDAIVPLKHVVVEAGDAGDQLRYCKDREVYCVFDGLSDAGDVDTVQRAWKGGLGKYSDAHRDASKLMLDGLERGVKNSIFGGSGAAVVPVLRSTDTVLDESFFAWGTAAAVARGTGGEVAALISRTAPKGKTPAGNAKERRAFHDDSDLRVNLDELRRLVEVEGVTQFLLSDDDAGTGASIRAPRNVLKDALVKLDLEAAVDGVVATRYCHDTTGRALKPKIRDAFADVASVRAADGSATDAGTHCGVIYSFKGVIYKVTRRYDGSHGVPRAIWEREWANLEAALAKGEAGQAEVREVLARLVSKRAGEHQRHGERGTHNARVNAFFEDFEAENGGEVFSVPKEIEVLAVMCSKKGESRTQFFEKLREYEQLYLDRLKVMVKSTALRRIRLVSHARLLTTRTCAGGQIEKLTVVEIATGAGAVTELVPDPRRPGVICRHCDLWVEDPRRPGHFCASYNTLDARDLKASSTSQREYSPSPFRRGAGRRGTQKGLVDEPAATARRRRPRDVVPGG